MEKIFTENMLNAIKSMQSETARIGGFPFGDNSEKKLWANLYRASYRGDRIKNCWRVC